MIRQQAQLTPEQVTALKALARERQVSVARLLREGADLVLANAAQPTQAELRERARSVFGTFRGTGEPVAQNHDHYLAEIYADHSE